MSRTLPSRTTAPRLTGALLLGLVAGCGAGTTPASTGPGIADARPAQTPPASASRGAAGDDLPGLDLSRHSRSDPSSPWVVVNKATPLDPIDYVPDLTEVRGYRVRHVVADDLTALLSAAADDGVSLTLRSAYRSFSYQTQVYGGWVAKLGRAKADRVSARPGHSEHQTGLAVDLGSSTRPECDFSTCFDDTVEGRWIAEHATQFGFIVRYTTQNSATTGFDAEGWHLRYVGRELAEYMDRSAISTLEEVFDAAGGPDYR